jgi:hypothetical protein
MLKKNSFKFYLKSFIELKEPLLTQMIDLMKEITILEAFPKKRKHKITYHMLIISLKPEKTSSSSARLPLPILENRMAETKAQLAASNVDTSP